jgi:hypothetical protein
MMRFQPRYSLLMLMLLTAITAWGIKLWRGPHRCVAADPPTQVEEEFLASYTNPFELGQFRHWPDCFCEYTYLQSWGERTVLTVRYFISEPETYVIVGEYKKSVQLLLPLEELHGQPCLDPDPRKRELLHHVCYLADCPESELEHGIGIKFLPWDKRVYCISNWGKIYRLDSFNLYIWLQPVNLERLPDKICERLREEANLIR